jgi:hypothetical protein
MLAGRQVLQWRIGRDRKGQTTLVLRGAPGKGIVSYRTVVALVPDGVRDVEHARGGTSAALSRGRPGGGGHAPVSAAAGRDHVRPSTMARPRRAPGAGGQCLGLLPGGRRTVAAAVCLDTLQRLLYPIFRIGRLIFMNI